MRSTLNIVRLTKHNSVWRVRHALGVIYSEPLINEHRINYTCIVINETPYRITFAWSGWTRRLCGEIMEYPYRKGIIMINFINTAGQIWLMSEEKKP